jgi:hypothetical protein
MELIQEELKPICEEIHEMFLTQFVFEGKDWNIDNQLKQFTDFGKNHFHSLVMELAKDCDIGWLIKKMQKLICNMVSAD